MLLGAREQECLLLRKRQPVMAATRGVIQHRARFAIPFRQRVGDPANVVKVAVNVQWTFGSKNIADDGDFVGARCRSSQHCANGEADNFICPHFEPFQLARLENLNGPIKFINGKIDIVMSHQPTESKRLLSYVIAEWACYLKYEHLSPAAIQAAKLFWFDSIGCALGGSQQEDAKILLEHYRAMSANRTHSSCGEGGGNGKATAFVSGFKTNPVDAAFLNGHMIRAMDYNDIYWKADPCHPSDLIAAPLALCESEGLSGKDLILATIIAYEIEMRLCEIGRPGVREYGWHHATLSAFAAPVAAGRVLNLKVDQMVSAIGISAARTFCPGAVTAGKITDIKKTGDPGAGRKGTENAPLARDGVSGPPHIIDGKEGLFAVFHHVQYKGQPATFDSEALVAALPDSNKSHYRIL